MGVDQSCARCPIGEREQFLAADRRESGLFDRQDELVHRMPIRRGPIAPNLNILLNRWLRISSALLLWSSSLSALITSARGPFTCVYPFEPCLP